MKILLLYNNEIAKKFGERLVREGNEIIFWDNPVTISIIETIHPDSIISYTYRHIISGDVIRYCHRPILNMHISYLPWNRGAVPNFWSFVDDTPKGVTIHEIDEKIDTGKILLQKEVEFDEKKESFESTYETLNEQISKLFFDNMNELLAGTMEGYYPLCSGSYHAKKDFSKFVEKYPVSWDMNIAEYKQNIGI